MALEGAWQPWSYHDESDTLVGYDVEVSRAIAEKLGVEPEYVESDWDSLFAGLDAGRFDMVCNGVEVTDERALTYDFTTPYGYIHTALAVRKDNNEIKTFEDLKGKTTANSLAPKPLHEYADDVDILMGTGNSRWMYKPSVSLPFGMVQIAPDNEDEKWKAGYEYTIENIAGFNHFCDWTIDGFLMQPTCGELQVNPGPEDNPDAGYRSRIDKSTEKAEVGKYSVFMTDTKITAEVSATDRASIQRYTFPAGCKNRRVLVDLYAPSEYPHNLQDAHITKVSDTEIEGYATYFGAYTGAIAIILGLPNSNPFG